MTALYPLRMQPLLKRYLWGGRRLGELLGKPLAEGSDYAESWELCDRQEEQTCVLSGPLQGTPLATLVKEHNQELFGRHAPQAAFPLLFKFLDAQQMLSVQVHPDDARAARLNPPDLGKTEAWVVLAADPGSRIYAGLKRGIDRAALARELARGTCHLCLHALEPKPGDCLFLPAGVVHALGAGLLIAEIQQSSNTTYRLFDWNRLGADGKPRELHIERAMDAINFSAPPVEPQMPRPTDRDFVERLVACDKFVMDRWRLDGTAVCGGDDRFHFLAVLEGSLSVEGDPATEPLRPGGTVLLPACLGEVSLTAEPAAFFLDIYLP
jgi:mannose-6-phosphate isomerase